MALIPPFGQIQYVFPLFVDTLVSVIITERARNFSAEFPRKVDWETYLGSVTKFFILLVAEQEDPLPGFNCPVQIVLSCGVRDGRRYILYASLGELVGEELQFDVIDIKEESDMKAYLHPSTVYLGC